MSSPLPFAPPTLHDGFAVRHATDGAWQSDLAFANIYLLRRKYGTELAFEGGVLFRHYGGHGRLRGYAFPCGSGDMVSALRRIEEDAALRARPFRFCLLTAEQLLALQQLYPSRFTFRTDRGDSDYLYSRSALAELPGARFHRKRNHIARFERAYPGYRVEPLTLANAADALEVATAWLTGAEEYAPTPALQHEHEAISHALEHQEELSLFGTLLYAEARPVAMCLGSMISADVADIHYEKCIPSFRSAYPVINRAQAEALSCTLINREEDLNQEGLRQAKLSYFPSRIVTKYNALPC